METIRKDGFAFQVDIEKTKEYYSSNSICDCSSCRNLYAQIKTISAKLTDFLLEFGIDICRPDESADVVMNAYIDYLFVGYTVVGSIETEGSFETDIDGFHVKISEGNTTHDWFPNEQKGPCFFVTIEGISLPWILAEPFPYTESFLDKVKAFFKKKEG